VLELEDFLFEDFETFPEVHINYQFTPDSGRIDLLAVPKSNLNGAFAIEVKRDGFHVERALKQSADYVGGRVLEGPHKGKCIAACFLYPVASFSSADCWDRGRYHAGMFQLIAQWRVGRGYVKRDGLWLAIGQEIIWDSKRGWHVTVANRMLLSRRKVGGSRKAPWR
jgi:hypothetical protein